MKTFFTRWYYYFSCKKKWPIKDESLASYADSSVQAEDGFQIPFRTYTPQLVNNSAKPLPVIIYYHGGGHVIGDIKTYHGLMFNLCLMTQAIIVIMDYRRAPEFKYPTPLNDSLSATKWALEHCGEFGGDEKRVLLMGDSAGGNLAAIITQELKNEKANQILGQVLVSPMTVYHKPPTRSFVENAKQGPLTAGWVKWFHKQHLPKDFDVNDANIFPLMRDDLSGTPASLVLTAELDVLRDDGNSYAEKLNDVGTETVHINYPNQPHNHPLGQDSRNPKRDKDMSRVVEWITELFNRSVKP